jgi:Protein of unknown function (DUF2934)
MTVSNATPAGEEEISARAYEIWESEGRPEGRDEEHWFRARELVAGSAGNDGPGQVRPAGRKEMDMPPPTWSKTDEEVDESFPASDPPGNY